MGAAQQHYPQIIDIQQLDGIQLIEIQQQQTSKSKQVMIGRGKTVYKKEINGLQIEIDDFQTHIPKNKLQRDEDNLFPVQNYNYLAQGFIPKTNSQSTEEYFTLFDTPLKHPTSEDAIIDIIQIKESARESANNSACKQKCLNIDSTPNVKIDKHGDFLKLQVNSNSGFSTVMINSIEKSVAQRSSAQPNEVLARAQPKPNEVLAPFAPIVCENILIPIYDPNDGIIAITPQMKIDSVQFIRTQKQYNIQYQIQTCFQNSQCYTFFEYEQVFPKGTTTKEMEDVAYSLVVGKHLNANQSDSCGIALIQQ